MAKAGFADVRAIDERPLGVDDCERYPLFTSALIAVMRRMIPVGRQDAVARSLVFLARKP